MDKGLLVSALVSLFVVVDPVGTSAVFATLAQDIPARGQRRIALKGVAIAITLILLFSVIGKALLNYMHVSLAAFRIAGGLLLFVTAFRMIMGFHDPDQLRSDSSAYKDLSNIAIFPIAIPFLAGPGVMTATLMFITEATNIGEHLTVIFAIIVIQIFALICMCSASALSRVFGSGGRGIIARVMGILLAAMAVQFVADGIKTLM